MQSDEADLSNSLAFSKREKAAFILHKYRLTLTLRNPLGWWCLSRKGMAYSVKELAEISGVSIRTLHFYDEIGLLKPAYHGTNGYRYYEDEQVLLLQQILFYRELGFELRKIQGILAQTDFNKLAALHSHRKLLKANLAKTRGLIETIDKTIQHLKGETTMSNQEMFQGFSKEQQEAYESELVMRYGDQAGDLVKESKNNTRSWTKNEWKQVKDEQDAICKALAQAIDQKQKVDSKQVQSLIQRHFALISRFYNPTKTVYVGLGELYTDHTDFRKLYDAYHIELAQFLANAMKVYAQRNLS